MHKPSRTPKKKKKIPIRRSRHCSGIDKSAVCFFFWIGQHTFRNVKYEKLKNNDDVLRLFLWRPARETQKQKTIWSEYYEYEDNILQLQTENYTFSTRLWLSYFICDSKHTFVKQVSPDFAMLLALLLKTVGWLDNCLFVSLRVYWLYVSLTVLFAYFLVCFFPCCGWN